MNGVLLIVCNESLFTLSHLNNRNVPEIRWEIQLLLRAKIWQMWSQKCESIGVDSRRIRNEKHEHCTDIRTSVLCYGHPNHRIAIWQHSELDRRFPCPKRPNSLVELRRVLLWDRNYIQQSFISQVTLPMKCQLQAVTFIFTAMKDV